METIGPFRILGLLGRGGMGAVYRARDDELARDVAIKLILDQRTAPLERAESRARLAREVEAMARIDHPNVVRVHSSGIQGTDPYVVLELMTGGSLEDRIARGGPLPWREACTLL
ncbi:MAG: protein kinase, partial [Planctomycetota bacterium]